MILENNGRSPLAPRPTLQGYRWSFPRPRAAAWLLGPIMLFAPAPTSWAGEGPFFITYTHQMEEPGNLEFGSKSVMGRPTRGNRFWGTTAEFEYGVKGWWTTEVYLDGQT